MPQAPQMRSIAKRNSAMRTASRSDKTNRISESVISSLVRQAIMIFSLPDARSLADVPTDLRGEGGWRAGRRRRRSWRFPPARHYVSHCVGASENMQSQTADVF
jgi:hypothetical protein